MAFECDLEIGRPLSRAMGVRLVQHPWETHFIVNSLLTVLLSSALSFNVSRVPMPTGPETYEALSTGQVHIDAETWPDSHPEAYDKFVRARASVVSAGGIGYSGRSGLFATSALLRGEDCDTWRALHRRSVVSRLPLVRDLDDESATREHVGEFAACAGPRAPPSERDPSACGALLHIDHTFDRDIVEALVDGLKLNVSVWYAGSESAHDDLVRQAAEWDEPMLAYAYHPSTLLATLNTTSLRRLALPEEYRGCDHSFTREKKGRLECDFAAQSLLKLHTPSLERSHPSAERLLRALSFKPEELEELLRRMHEHDFEGAEAARRRAAGSKEEDAELVALSEALACAWLRENRERWEPWVAAALGEESDRATTLALAATLVSLALCGCLCTYLHAHASRRLRLARRMGIDVEATIFGPAEDGAAGKARRAAKLAAFAVGCAGPEALADEPKASRNGSAAERAQSDGSVGLRSGSASTLDHPEERKSWLESGNARNFAISLVLIGAAIGLSIGAYGALEGWSTLDASYFAIVTLTTVGYGDLTPATQTGRGFTIAFAIASMAVLGFALVAFVAGLLEAQEAARKRIVSVSIRSLYAVRDSSALRRMSVVGSRARSVDATGHAQHAAAAASAQRQLRAAELEEAREASAPESACQFIRTMVRLSQPIVVCLMGGLVLGVLVEGWNAIDSFYYAVITVTTIGYGDLSPKTTLGRALACAYLPISVASVAKAVQDIAQHVSIQWTLHRTHDVEKLLRAAGVAEMNETDFLLYMISQLYGVDPRVMSAIRTQFLHLDVDHNNKVDYGDVKLMLERQREARDAVRAETSRRGLGSGAKTPAAPTSVLVWGKQDANAGMAPAGASRSAGEASTRPPPPQADAPTSARARADPPPSGSIFSRILPGRGA